MCAGPSALSARPGLIQASCLHPWQHKFTAQSAFSDGFAVRSQVAASPVAGSAATTLGGACGTRGAAAGQLSGGLCFWPLCPLHHESLHKTCLGMCLLPHQSLQLFQGTTTGACCCCRLHCHAKNRRGHSWQAPTAARAPCATAASPTAAVAAAATAAGAAVVDIPSRGVPAAPAAATCHVAPRLFCGTRARQAVADCGHSSAASTR